MKNFPIKKKIDKNELVFYNLKQYKKDHSVALGRPLFSFLCKGEIELNKNYLEMIDKQKDFNFSFDKILSVINFKNNDFEKNNIIKCVFVGTIFGNLIIYKFFNKDKENTPESKEITETSDATNFFMELNKDYKNKFVTMLCDHYSEIIYIDFNPRLNLFVDYALDGYINLYTFPSLKLVNVIQIKDYIGEIILEGVVLISRPYPMIFCYNKRNEILFDINGNLINKIKYGDDSSYEFAIDKNCGIVNDYIFVNKRKYIIELPSLEREVFEEAKFNYL